MRKYELSVNNKPYHVEVKSVSAESAQVEVNGSAYEVKIHEVVTQKSSKPVSRVMPATASPAVSVPAPPPLAGTGGAGAVRAPIPGSILAVFVNVGDMVTAHQPVVKMEAMKMENEISTHAAGTVQSIGVKVGDSVKQGQELLVIA